ncbi:MAG: isoprenoid biosynthesis glyoxalase ElbB [Bacteroidales bacterium]|nr:isoprenoid biosynthesis glyoxalase ElbB [Bacteroidales bacterium]
MKKKIAVILCGCGAIDGSEIHEATMTLLAIDQHGAKYQAFAPNMDQYDVVNHITGEKMNEKRNMMVEAARITRGNILPLEDLHPEEFDALVFPGGFGAAKNLFTYAIDGVNAKVRKDISTIIKKMHELKRPIGGLCIAPVMIAKVLGNVVITVGTDKDTINDVETFGATHINTQQREVIADKKNMIFTTPCYMLPASIADIARCADKLIDTMLENIN